MTDKPIDVVAEPQAVVVREPSNQALVPSNLFGASDAVAVVQKATAVATALREVIEKQGLISKIQGKSYPKCEAWTLLGTMLGVFPVLQWTKQIANGWEARVEARTRDGAVVGAAEAECLRSERNWSNRDDFALRSMAQTRATAKALRMPLGFVMTLSGYEPTPAEEMVSDHPQNAPQAKTRCQATAPPPAAANTKPCEHRQPITCATPEQKVKLLEALAPQKELAERYMKAIDWLFPTEPIEKLELAYVPVTKKQFDLLMDRLEACKNGEPAVAPYPPNPTPDPPTKPKAEKPAEPGPEAPKIDPSWLVAEGVIETVNLKEGKKKDGTGWSLWGIKLGGEWHNSFSNRIGHFARDAYHSKQLVKLYYTLDKDNRREAQEIV